MNWLDDLTRKIRGSGGRMNQIEPLVLCATELSRICDLYMKRAPAPELESPSEGAMQLSWFWVEEQRSLTVGVDRDPTVTYLLMMDGTRNNYTSCPTHEELKRAVQSFFDGWTAR
jgi:hypothetical protein